MPGLKTRPPNDYNGDALVPRVDRLIILCCLAAITILSWVYLLHLSREMTESMAEMDAMAKMGMVIDMTWTVKDVWLTFAMWSVMMVGMMTASAVPAVLVMARSRAARGEGHLSPVTLTFATGYLLVWVGFSAAAALAQWGLHEAALVSDAMRTSNRWLGGSIVIVAGVYQWTPLKRACLSHCQNPFNFLVAHWQSGFSGALFMGLHHGVYCVGCCWALMGVLFVVGVMNLIGVALIALLVLVEKVSTAGPIVSRVAGAGLVVAGVIMIST